MVYTNFNNQDYKALKDECARNGRLFEDPEFPATNSSLYFSRQPPFTAEWKRPKVMFEYMIISGFSHLSAFVFAKL